MHRNQTIKIMEHIFVLYISLLPIIQWYNYIGNLWLSLPYLILKVSFTQITTLILILLSDSYFSVYYLCFCRLSTLPSCKTTILN